MDFTKAAKVITNTRDLSLTATLASGKNSLVQQTEIPEDARQAMIEQGMQTESAFSPGTPISPFEPVGSEPQQYQFIIGQNIVQQPRSTENTGFATMRNLIENYDVAQMCIEARLDQLRNLDWDIVRQDAKDRTDYSKDIKVLRDFFRKPDGTHLFDDWLSPIANDLISYDAPAIYKEHSRNGKLGALQILDGTTITPLIDGKGRMPKSPAPAYIQFTYGMPRYWLTAENVIYRPWRLRSHTVYGFPAVEWLLMNINQDFRHQYYFLQYFTDGSVPDVFAETPASIEADPDKIRKFQEYYDQVMVGDQSQKHKVKWIPNGSKVTKMKSEDFDVDFPMFLFNKTLAAFKVTPAELGFTEKVNKSSGESQENVQYRRSIRPMAKYFEIMFDEIIAELGYPHLSFRFQNLGEQEDLLTAARVREIDIKNGVISPDEAAEMAYGIPPDPENPTPRLFIVNNNVFTVQDAIAQGNAQLQLTLAQAKQVKTPPAQAAPKEVAPLAEEPDPKAGDPKNKAAAKVAKRALTEQEMLAISTLMPKKDLEALDGRQNSLQETITKFFQIQPEEVARHIADGIKGIDVTESNAEEVVNKLLETYGWQGWDKHLKPAIYNALVDTAKQGGTEAAKAHEVELTYDMIDPHAVEYAQKRAADLVGTGVNSDYHIADSTRDFIRNTVTDAVSNGTSVQDLANQLTDEYAFSDARALTIARTETALAYNKGSLIGYDMAGVPAVQVIDGDSDVECADANGQVWSLDFASDNMLQHPRCVRHFAGIPKKWFDGNYDME